MIKVRATASFGFHGCYHEEDFEFPDDISEEDIEDELWDWANQFVALDWHKVKEVKV